MGDLNDILISPEPAVASSAPGSKDAEDDYEDEFEDDFEDEDSRRSGKSQEIEPFDISKSEDSKTYFEHAVQSPEQHARPDSRSVSGSNESDESDPNQLQGSRFEEEDVEAFEESMDVGRSVKSPPKPFVRAAHLANTPPGSASAPAPIRQQYPAPTPPDAPNASMNKSSSFTRTLLAPPVAPKFSLPSAVFDELLEVAAHAALPADMNEHPVPAAHFSSRRSAFATTVDTGEEMGIADTEARKKKGESDQSASMLQSVHGPRAKGVPAFNAIRRVAAWEVPGVSGVSAGGQNEAIKQTAAAEQEKKIQEEDRSQLVLTVLELLQSAAKKSEAQREVEFAIKSSSTTHVSSFHMGGVTRAQAMQANGKFFMSRVPDYDPDFDSALQFLDNTTDDRTSETQEKAARAELRTLQEERERLRQKKEAQLSWERDANTSLESRSLGEAGSSPDTSIQVVNSSVDRDSYSGRLTMANRNLSGNPYRRTNKTYPPGRATGPHASASHGAQNMKENTTSNNNNNAHKTHPVAVRSGGAETGRDNLRGSSDGERDRVYPASPDTAASVTNTSPGSSPGIHSGSPGQQQQQQQGKGPMRAGGWPAPLQQRKDVLANLPVSRASQLNSTCESLYASFLADLIGNCKKRANECKDTEEMAMLKALSDHVFATFAGERLEDVQCKMLQGAVNVLDRIGPNRPSGEKTPLAQRLENPIRR